MLKSQLPSLNQLFNSINVDLNTVVINKKFVNFWKHYDSAIGILSVGDFVIFRGKIKNNIPKDFNQKSYLQLYNFFDEVYIYSLLYKQTGHKPNFIKEDKQKKPDMKLKVNKQLSIIEVKHISYSDNEIKLNDSYFHRALNKQKQSFESVELNVHPTFFKKIDVNIENALTQISSHTTIFSCGIIFLILRLDHNAFADLAFNKPSSIISYLNSKRMMLKSIVRQIDLRVIYDTFASSEERFISLLV
ncbi:MAG TPA: hypothetical protein VJB63_02160 [Patescibacteria group bacterium]|nr:hypothetical protein [Patescibacteria group bacterium]